MTKDDIINILDGDTVSEILCEECPRSRNGKTCLDPEPICPTVAEVVLKEIKKCKKA